MVQTNTVTPTGHTDAAVIRIKGTKKGLAMKTDCNARYVYLNPLAGGKIAVAECARNIACSGAKPLAITNCLNFGNPLKPEVYFQFKESVRGMGEACRAFNTPVTGGNVSFYNETFIGGQRTAIYPTPTIGMIGLLDDIDNLVGSTFTNAGDLIILVGNPELTLNGSEYLVMQYGTPGQDSPAVDLEHEANLQRFLVALAEQKLVHSAHDISDGGFFVTLAEKAVMNAEAPLGFIVNLEDEECSATRLQQQLFSEAQGRVVLSVAPEKFHEIATLAVEHKMPLQAIGTVVERAASLSINGREIVNLTIDELSEAYFHALEQALHLDELL
jgi:phosphoribosylformylglycinamidine (FGAM) synthase-like enzyme